MMQVRFLHGAINLPLGFEMLNSAMTFSAMQQSHNYTDALRAMGVAAGCHDVTGIHYVTRGPVAIATRLPATADLNSFRRHMRGKLCIVNPNARLDAQGFRQILTPAATAIIPLTSPLHLHPKARSALKKARRSRLTITHRLFHQSNDNWVLRADLEQQKVKGFRSLPHDIIRNWPKNETRIFMASLQGVTLAAMIFLEHDQSVTYQLGWSDDIGRALCAHQLLLDCATTYFAERGFYGMDLGTVDTVNARGLARFKRRAGAVVQELGGTWAALPAWRS